MDDLKALVMLTHKKLVGIRFSVGGFRLTFAKFRRGFVPFCDSRERFLAIGDIDLTVTQVS